MIPRTVPKTVAIASTATNKKTTRSKMRRMEFGFPKVNWTRGKMRGMSESANWKRICRGQAARSENRGGGERGSNELTELCGPERAANNSKFANTEIVAGAGSTKMAGATAGRSGLLQQDMLHWAVPGISWPQSIACS